MSDLILVTGASGYVGSCLIPRLLEKGYRVRVLVRDPGRLQGRTWLPQVEIAQADLSQPASLGSVFVGVRSAVYLVHNMSSGLNYESLELQSARNFVAAAQASAIEHILYLGGLANPGEQMGPHLLSRLRTGEVLRAGQVPLTEFRSSLIIGSGSISFEMIRYLAEQMPVIVGRRDLQMLTQPISIQNVLEYLLTALETPACRGRIYEIGGSSVLSYADTLRAYARLRGLTRRILLLPWFPEALMGFFAGHLTPVPARIARPLIGGMQGHSIVHDVAALQMFPGIQLHSYDQAVRLALDNLEPSRLEPVWLNHAGVSRMKREGFFIENRQVRINRNPEAVYRVLAGLGGRNGWLYLDGLWKLRGWIDRRLGGPGLRGGSLGGSPAVGQVLDFYHLELLLPGQLLRLKAELKTPGVGWMEWRMDPTEDGQATRLSQTVFYAPRGLAGFFYWYSLWPVHTFIFAGLIRAIAKKAMKSDHPGGNSHGH